MATEILIKSSQNSWRFEINSLGVLIGHKNAWKGDDTNVRTTVKQLYTLHLIFLIETYRVKLLSN